MGDQFNITPRTVKLINAQVLTASFTSAGSVGYLETNTGNFLGLLIAYTKGDETGVQVKVDITCDKTLGILADTASLASATNWFQRVAETTSTGIVSLVGSVYEVDVTGNYAEVISPMKGDGVRISVKANTLGSSPGTVTIYGITSWV